LPPSLLRLQR